MSDLVALSLRVDATTKATLSDLADGMGASMSALLDTFVRAYLPDAFDNDPELVHLARQLTAERRRTRGPALRCDCRQPPAEPKTRGPRHSSLCRMFEDR